MSNIGLKLHHGENNANTTGFESLVCIQKRHVEDDCLVVGYVGSRRPGPVHGAVRL